MASHPPPNELKKEAIYQNTKKRERQKEGLLYVEFKRLDAVIGSCGRIQWLYQC